MNSTNLAGYCIYPTFSGRPTFALVLLSTQHSPQKQLAVPPRSLDMRTRKCIVMSTPYCRHRIHRLYQIKRNLNNSQLLLVYKAKLLYSPRLRSVAIFLCTHKFNSPPTMHHVYAKNTKSQRIKHLENRDVKRHHILPNSKSHYHHPHRHTQCPHPSDQKK